MSTTLEVRRMRVSIFWKLIAIVVLAVLLTSSVLFFTTNHYVTEGFNEKVQDELRNAKVAVETGIADWEDLLQNLGFLMAENFQVQSAASQRNSVFLQQFAQEMMRRTGVEFITISDSKGDVIARGHSDRVGDNVMSQLNVQKALAEEASVGFEAGTEVKFSLRAGQPIKMANRMVGVITLGLDLGTFSFVDDIKRRVGVEATVFEGDTSLATTIFRDGQRVVGTKMENPDVISTVLRERQDYVDREMIIGQSYDSQAAGRAGQARRHAPGRGQHRGRGGADDLGLRGAGGPGGTGQPGRGGTEEPHRRDGHGHGGDERHGPGSGQERLPGRRSSDKARTKAVDGPRWSARRSRPSTRWRSQARK
jgi:hypothetical protein